MVSRSGSPGPAPTKRDVAVKYTRRVCASEGSVILDRTDRTFRIVMTARKHERTDRSIDDALPKTTTHRHLGQLLRDRLAPATDEASQIADPRRQHRLDSFANAARDDGRRSACADRHDNVTAIHDRRKDKRRMVEIVHDVDRQALLARPHHTLRGQDHPRPRTSRR